MDPLGFALENFNTVGQLRELDSSTHTPIDTAGVLADGTVINGPDDLRRALVARSELFVQTLTGQLMSYAVGRPLDYYDMPVVRRIARDVARDHERFSSIVLQVVESDAFRRREPPAQESQPAVKSASLAASAAATASAPLAALPTVPAAGSTAAPATDQPGGN
jgi:hypothetical protein